jgi:rhodanese-related sulfurtransferase
MRLPSTFLAQAGMLLALAVTCALVSNLAADSNRRLGWQSLPPAASENTQASSASMPAATGAPLDIPSRFQPDPAQPIRTLSSEEAWLLFQARVPFLDARRHSEFLAGHVEGAWNISVWEADAGARITEFEAGAGPQSTDPIVIYCSGGGCEDSHLLASKLTPLGYRNLWLYQAGYPDWIQQRRPIRQGERP